MGIILNEHFAHVSRFDYYKLLKKYNCKINYLQYSAGLCCSTNVSAFIIYYLDHLVAPALLCPVNHVGGLVQDAHSGSRLVFIEHLFSAQESSRVVCNVNCIYKCMKCNALLCQRSTENSSR